VHDRLQRAPQALGVGHGDARADGVDDIADAVPGAPGRVLPAPAHPADLVDQAVVDDESDGTYGVPRVHAVGAAGLACRRLR
jgi:hypothetical protein